ncbi:MAG TPA: mechanosensitive ion channel domain-containing protein [Chitinophagaceae bacterium]
MQDQIEELLRQWHLSRWQWNSSLFAAAVLLGLFLKLLLTLFVRKKAAEITRFSWFRSILRHMGPPFTWFLPLFFLNLVLPIMQLPLALENRLAKIVEIGLIITFSWILLRSVRVVQDYVFHSFDFNKANNLRERKIRTQLLYIRQIVVALIIFLTIAAVLLTFSSLRKIGAGLLTGVGIGGIIIGFAAQRSLGNLLAGLQIAFTQPIRIDDAVLIEGEFGRVEEITLTYVVIRLWDERRLILPINYFIEKPFQNWTRHSAELLGTVILYTDYTVPVEAIREELKRLVKDNPLWDGKAVGLEVTDTTPDSVQLRALISARTSGDAWTLRCAVRESLVQFITKNYPESLPKTRAELEQVRPSPPPANGII